MHIICRDVFVENYELVSSICTVSKCCPYLQETGELRCKESSDLISRRLFEFLPKGNHYGLNLFQLFVLKLIQEDKTKLNCS